MTREDLVEKVARGMCCGTDCSAPSDAKEAADAIEALVKERDEAIARAEKAEAEADMLEQVFCDTAEELGCEPDNEKVLMHIYALRALLADAGEALAEVVRISDRKHVAWDNARVVLRKIKGEAEPTDATNDGQPDEAQEWRDFDPDC